MLTLLGGFMGVPYNVRLIISEIARMLFVPALMAGLAVSTTRCEHYQQRAEHCEAQAAR